MFLTQTVVLCISLAWLYIFFSILNPLLSTYVQFLWDEKCCYFHVIFLYRAVFFFINFFSAIFQQKYRIIAPLRFCSSKMLLSSTSILKEIEYNHNLISPANKLSPWNEIAMAVITLFAVGLWWECLLWCFHLQTLTLCALCGDKWM